MAPPKAPAGKGPQAGASSGGATPPLTARDIHELVLRVLSLAALADGSSVTAGSKLEAHRHDGLRMLRDLVGHIEARAPLAGIATRGGVGVANFRLEHFDLVRLYDELTAICKAQAKLLGTRHFHSEPFASALILAFGRSRIRLSKKDALGLVDHVKKNERHQKPSAMAGAILREAGFPDARQMQNFKKVARQAALARAHLDTNDYPSHVVPVEEFLVCLQVPPTEVGWRAAALLAQRQRRRKGSGQKDYALRDASSSQVRGHEDVSE